MLHAFVAWTVLARVIIVDLKSKGKRWFLGPGESGNQMPLLFFFFLHPPLACNVGAEKQARIPRNL